MDICYIDTMGKLQVAIHYIQKLGADLLHSVCPFKTGTWILPFGGFVDSSELYLLFDTKLSFYTYIIDTLFEEGYL